MLKIILEVLPLLLFFSSYNIKGIIFATSVLIISTLVSLVVIYMVEKKISYTSIFSALLLSIFGGLSIFSGDSVFIKVKPTILNTLFATILFVSAFLNKNIIKYVMADMITMEPKAWKILTIRFGGLFTFLAILNEIMWRNFSEKFWVNFKVFGILPITIIFVLLQLSFIKKNTKI